MYYGSRIFDPAFALRTYRRKDEHTVFVTLTRTTQTSYTIHTRYDNLAFYATYPKTAGRHTRNSHLYS